MRQQAIFAAPVFVAALPIARAQTDVNFVRVHPSATGGLFLVGGHRFSDDISGLRR